MEDSYSEIINCFSSVKDPRVDRTKRHKLIDIMFIAICSIICGGEGWEHMQTFGTARKDWLKTFLELPHGIPGHDTFRRVFERIDPKVFAECFLRWIQEIATRTLGDIVAIDGKTLRGSGDQDKELSPIHMVSAWSACNQMVLGQVKTNEKSNEITAIPELLDVIDVAGCIVTIDAMGCQKKIVSKIIDKKADYVLALKGNQGLLRDDVELYLKEHITHGFHDILHDNHKTLEKDHGRIEARKYWVTSDIDWLLARHKGWKNLASIGVVESTREIKGIVSVDYRFYISSLKANAKEFAGAVRRHWQIENCLHWCLDVGFQEDKMRIRNDNSPQNLAVLRHMALNILKKDKELKKGLRAKQFLAALDVLYLEKVLFPEKQQEPTI